MKRYILTALLAIGGLFIFIHPAHSAVVFEDKMVFKINTKVFSLNDLKTYHKMINNLACTYDESLLIKLFKDEFSLSKLKLYKLDNKYSVEQKAYFSELIDFAKLYVYSTSQTVVVDPKITKFFLLSAKQNKCDVSSFIENGEFTQEMQEILKLEIFVRSRFLPSEKNGKSTADDIKKALFTARNLMSSIGRQIEDEVYW